MTKITKLTSEQVAKFPEWVNKWVEIGLSTEPADFDRATSAALRAYEFANLKRPMIILRMSSPYGATIGGIFAWVILNEIKKSKNVGSQVGSQVESQVWSQVGSQVRSQVESQVGSQVGSQVWSQVWSQVGSQVGSQVWSQVRSQVGSQVESQVGSQVGSQVWSQVGSAIENYGINSLWSSWGAYIAFFRDVCGWKNKILERFTIDEDLIKSCGWTWWQENILAISDRPLFIKRDDQGRLHGESGPAMAYRDGWSLWFWHGVSIPSGWITDKNGLTPQAALTWQNVEQRRAACEIIGWDNILYQLKARSIDKDADPQIGELVEVELPGLGHERFLRVKCGTGRKFALPVPRNINTALQANAWTYALDGDTLKQLEIRT